MKRTVRILTVFSAVLLLMAVLAVPAFAITEAEVEAQVSATSRETVTGNVLIWFLCAIAFLKVSQKIDSFLASLGINAGQTGSSMLSEVMLATRGITTFSGTSGGGRSAASGNSSHAFGASGGFMKGGLAGMVGRKITSDAVKTATTSTAAVSPMSASAAAASQTGTVRNQNSAVSGQRNTQAGSHQAVQNGAGNSVSSQSMGSMSYQSDQSAVQTVHQSGQTISSPLVNNQSGQTVNSQFSQTVGGAQMNSQSSQTVGGAHVNSQSSQTVGGAQMNSQSSQTVGGAQMNSQSSQTVGGAQMNSQFGQTVGGTQMNSQSSQTVGGAQLNSQSSQTVGGVQMNSQFNQTVGSTHVNGQSGQTVDSSQVVQQSDQAISGLQVTNQSGQTISQAVQQTGQVVSGSTGVEQPSQTISQAHSSVTQNFSQAFRQAEQADTQVTQNLGQNISHASQQMEQSGQYSAAVPDAGTSHTLVEQSAGYRNTPTFRGIGLGGALFAKSLSSGGSFANDVIGTVARGDIRSTGTITGDMAAQSIQSYLGYAGESGEGKTPLTFSNVEIGGGRITGMVANPDMPEPIAFGMYHTEQYAEPKGDFSRIRSEDGSVWYTQFAQNAVERKPYQASEDKVAYQESIVKRLPDPPKRKDRI